MIDDDLDAWDGLRVWGATRFALGLFRRVIRRDRKAMAKTAAVVVPVYFLAVSPWVLENAEPAMKVPVYEKMTSDTVIGSPGAVGFHTSGTTFTSSS